MRRVNLLKEILPRDFREAVELVRNQWRRNPLPIQLFLLLCLNLLIAPAVNAATGPEITHKAAYGLGLLGIVTVGLAIYLFAVILQPERF